MSDWWNVQNTSPMAYQPNTQFALPSWGGDSNQQMPVSPNLLPVVANPLAGAGGGGNAPVGQELNFGNLWGAMGSTNDKGVRSDGWGGLAIGGAQALTGAFMGAKQYQLAQEALSENKRQFQLNYDNQRKTVNTELEDRQRARVASNAGAYQSVGDYMAKNGV
jgi:hypothetical protein